MEMNQAAEQQWEAVEVEDGAAAGLEAEPGDPSRTDRGLVDMAMSTEPSTPLEQMEDPWNPEQGGTRRLLRAAQKAANVSGLPAIVDAAVALPEMWVQHRRQAETPLDEQPQPPVESDETG